ncbi:MAG: RNase adapter RapZ [Pseudomonadota bacterium]|nr:RNase adapter RapZ [Pseudomonadota bacterium]
MTENRGTATDIIIISGLSGSGKSVALQSLEDMGYYCIDNLPAVLLPRFADELLSDACGEITRAAISIDSRNQHFLASLDKNLKRLEELGLPCRTVFLEADEAALLQRYSETRRKHPLTDDSTSLLEGIRHERVLMEPLARQAAQTINTTRKTPHELRGLLRDFAGGGLAQGPSLLFESFGFKHGTPQEADFVFDVRCLPNPYWDPELRDLTGLDAPVIEFLEKEPAVADMVQRIYDFLDNWLPHFADQNRSYITVAIGCTGGQHRSVYIARQLSQRFSDPQFNVQLRHREF